jgi:hypothetical protein
MKGPRATISPNTDDIDPNTGQRITEDELEIAFSQGYEGHEDIYEGEHQGVKYRTTWIGGALHFWIFESPIVWRCVECSLCVPKAGDLDNAGEGNYQAYGVPTIWLDDSFVDEVLDAHEAKVRECRKWAGM